MTKIKKKDSVKKTTNNTSLKKLKRSKKEQSLKITEGMSIEEQLAIDRIENQELITLSVETLAKEMATTFYIGQDEYERARMEFNFIHISDSLALAFLFQCGGPPIGRAIEFTGKKGTYKSTMAILIGVCCQLMGFDVWYFDIEHKQDIGRLEQLGLDVKPVDMDSKDISLKGSKFLRPKRAEDVRKIVNSNNATGIKNICYILDSITALENKYEKDHGMKDIDTKKGKSDLKMATFATWMGQFLKGAIPGVSENDSILILVNQMRTAKAGHIFFLSSTGGNAIQYYESSKFSTREIYIKDSNAEGAKKFKAVVKDPKNSDITIWVAIEVEMPKTSSGPPIDKQYLFFDLATGFNKEWELLYLGERWKYVKIEGGRHYVVMFGKTQEDNVDIFLGPSLYKSVMFLRDKENIKLRNYLEDNLRKCLNLPSRAAINKDHSLWKRVRVIMKEKYAAMKEKDQIKAK